MKLKSQRDDFVVSEVCRFPLKGGGFAAYRLLKAGIGTVEATTQLARHWGIPPASIQHAGMKDRHANTSQLITIQSGPDQDFQGEQFEARYLGQAKRHVAASDLVANEFEITLRDFSESEAARWANESTAIASCIPNYFDRQRFGSVTASGRFVAAAWCKKDYEQTLFLALAEFNPHDSPAERAQREILRENWGNWSLAKSELQRSNRRSVVTYLCDHPEGFKKAVALLDRRMRSLYVSALQSRLWNDVAGDWIQVLLCLGDGAAQPESSSKAFESYRELVFPIGDLAKSLDELEQLRLPLPSGRKTDWPDGTHALVERAADRLGLQMHELRIPFPRDVFFARAKRPLFIRPRNYSCSFGPDSEEPGRYQVDLQFRLLPGQYATMLLRGIDHHLNSPPPTA